MNESEARQLLGLGNSPSRHEVKQAFRRAVKAWHPDAHPPESASHQEAAETTQLIYEAYRVLTSGEGTPTSRQPSNARTPWSVAEGRRNNRLEAIAAVGALVLMVIVAIIVEVIR